MNFSKYDGAGNDFVITEALWSDEEGGAVARRVCVRATGVGVDGLILVWQVDRNGIGVRFFNPDGTAYGTCGNGSRCVAHYAANRGLVGTSPFLIETSDSKITATVRGDWVELEYRMPVSVVERVRVEGPHGEAEGWLVRIGVPHFVLPLEEPVEGSIEEVCARIRRDPALGPEGANVNLVCLESRSRGLIRTFERGVEGEVQACGSGAMASVFALHEAGLCEPDLDLHVQGGCDLRITVPGAPDPDGTCRLRLAGPVRHLFDGVFPAERPAPGGVEGDAVAG